MNDEAELYVVKWHNPTSGKGSYGLRGVYWTEDEAKRAIQEFCQRGGIWGNPAGYTVHKVKEHCEDLWKKQLEQCVELLVEVTGLPKEEVGWENGIKHLQAKLAAAQGRDAWKVDASNSYEQIQDQGKQLTALQSRLTEPRTWTTAKPTREGWYWWRWNSASPRHATKLGPPDDSSNSDLWHCTESSRVPNNAFYIKEGEWCGPLPAPAEPSATKGEE